MSEVVTFKPGDCCANCGGPMPLVPLPSDAQRAAAADRGEPVPIPQRFDTATTRQIAEDGRLYRCDRCDSKVRTHATADAPDAAPTATMAGA